jgi:hypothetical protein
MAITPPVKGQTDWDTTLNTALIELDSAVTANAGKVNGVTVTNTPVIDQVLTATGTAQAQWKTPIAPVDLNTDQIIAGNKTFSDYTIIANGQVNGGFRFFGTTGFFGANAVGRQTVTGSRGGNAALASLLTALATLGLITDNTTA